MKEFATSRTMEGAASGPLCDAAPAGGAVPFCTQDEAHHVGSYGLATWRLPPPRVVNPTQSSAGVGALMQIGQSQVAGLQEVNVPAVAHDCFNFIVTTRSGHASARIGGQTFDFASGCDHAIFFPAGLASRWVGDGRVAKIFHIHIPVAIREGIAPHAVDGEAHCFEPGSSLHRLGAYAAAEFGRGPPSSLALDAWASLVLDGLARRDSGAKRGGLATWQVRRLTDRLEDEIGRNVGLDELAELVGLTPAHMCTAFRQTVGMPPHKWQMRRRIERAKTMLRNSDLTVTEISLSIGYSNPSHFSTLFKRVVGNTPRDWRRSQVY